MIIDRVEPLLGMAHYVCRPMAAEQLEAWFDATVAVRG